MKSLNSSTKFILPTCVLSCIIGINDWERTKKQDVLINITLFADLTRACQSDRIEDSIDYKEIKKQIIALVEASDFFLIEQLAETICQNCLAHHFVKAAQVRVDKPGPAGSQKASVSKLQGCAPMSDSDVFIAVGSNIEPHENIERALTTLNSQIAVMAISNFYRTAAVDRPDQPDFLNGVIKIQTDIPARKLKFELLRKIEDLLGRLRSEDKFAARTIDLDLILYGSSVINEPGLHLPDPAIRSYPFVAIALLELAPDLILPDTNTRLSDEPIIRQIAGLNLESDFTRRLRRVILGC